MKCQICNEELLNPYRDYLDGRILLESVTECPNKHYFEEFVTGCTAIWVYQWLALTYSYKYAPTKLEELKYKLIVLIGRLRYKLERR